MHRFFHKFLITGFMALALCASASEKGWSGICDLCYRVSGGIADVLYSVVKEWECVNLLCLIMIVSSTLALILRSCKKSFSLKWLIFWIWLAYVSWNDSRFLWADVFGTSYSYQQLLAVCFGCLVLTEIGKGIINLFVHIKQHKKKRVGEDPKLLLVDDDDSEDLLGFKEDADSLIEYLSAHVNEQGAVGVAVMGAWGTGKTRFLQYMGEALKRKKLTPIVFNPWMNKTDDPQYSLLMRIAEKMGMNDETQSLFERYVEDLKVSNVTGWASVIVIAVRKLLKWIDGDNSDVKTRLKNAMKRREHPTYVFIDDCDRLEFNAFKDVLSVIRGAADLPKLIFVVAFDAERAKKMLEKTGDDKFMQKMFNVPHVLTPVSEQVMTDYIGRNLDLTGIPLGEKKTALTNIIYTTYLPTFRETKRWLNMLNSDWLLFKDSPHKDQIDWNKWVFVELLKFCDEYLYERLKNNPAKLLRKEVKEDLNDHVYQLDEKVVAPYDESIKGLLHKIYSDKDIRNPYDVINITYHPIYFDANYKGKMLTKEAFLNHELEEDWKAIMDGWLKEDRFDNVPNLIADECKDMVSTDAYVLMTAYLESLCDYPGGDMRELNEGSKFSRYMTNAYANPFLGTLVWLTCTSVDDVEEDKRDEEVEREEKYCMETTRKYALAAIMLSSMKYYHRDELIGVRYLFIKVLEGMLQRNHPDVNGVILALSYCPQGEIKREFIDKFLDDRFIDCLPSLIVHIQDGDDFLLIARHNMLRALFDTSEEMDKTIKRWKNEARYDKALLDEFEKLTIRTMCYSPNNVKTLKKDNFPLLCQIKPIGTSIIMPLGAIKIKRDFWSGNSRFEEAPTFYFASDPN